MSVTDERIIEIMRQHGYVGDIGDNAILSARAIVAEALVEFGPLNSDQALADINGAKYSVLLNEYALLLESKHKVDLQLLNSEASLRAAEHKIFDDNSGKAIEIMRLKRQLSELKIPQKITGWSFLAKGWNAYRDRLIKLNPWLGE